MGSQASVNTNDKEQQLKKASKMSLILPNQNYEHPSMVALALISNPHETDDWEAFDIPFDYQRYGKEIDETKLAKGKYKLSIIFASSKNGATFEGAPGSTLLVDDVELIFE